MKTMQKPANLLPDIIAGLVNTIISIVLAMAFAAIIFTGPLEANLPQGVGILLLGMIIFAGLSAITATNPIQLDTPQEIPIVVLALIAVTVSSSAEANLSPTQLFQFMFVAISATSIFVGLFFFLLGRYKLGRIGRFIPLPVIGGFIAGMGWLIIEFAFSMMTNLDFTVENSSQLFQSNTFFRWFPSVLVAVSLLVANRFTKHFLLIPGVLFGGIFLFYAAMFAQGFSYSDIEKNGYLLGPFPTTNLFPGSPFSYVQDFRWDLYLINLPIIVTMMVLSVIEALLNYSALETTAEEDFDLDKELRSTGIKNILAGVAGAPAGFLRLNQTTLNFQFGVKSRITNIIIALLCTLTLIFGAEALSIFPKVILGGLLLYIGLGFLMEWLIDTWHKLPKSDYLIIVLILIIIVNFGFLEGVVIGLLMSTIFFVVSYSKIKVIKHELTGHTYKSNVERSQKLENIIAHHDEQILILSLQGFIFFGSTPQLLQPILKHFDQQKPAEQENTHLKFVVLDFRYTTGLDSSAINGFKKLHVKAKKHNFFLIFCGLSESMSQQLTKDGFFRENPILIRTFQDLDHGLEWCEDRIIEADQDRLDHSDDNENNHFLLVIKDFSDYLEELLVPSNATIIEQGKDPKGLYFIESGVVTIELNSDEEMAMRLKEMEAGTIVGEISLYQESNATASVIAKVDCKIKFLSRENFTKLNQQNPDKASQLHLYIVKLLSARLAKSNQTIKALMK